MSENIENNNLNKKNTKANFLKEKLLTADFAIWLTLSTAIFYGIYYAYTWYYLEYYHLGRQFIDFSLQGIANIVCIIVLVVTFFGLIISVLMEPKFSKLQDFIRKNIKFIYVPVLCICLILLLFTLLKYGFKASVTLSSVLGIVAIPPAIWIVRDEFKKLTKLTVILLVFICTVVASLTFGTYMASHKENYYILYQKNEQNEKNKQAYAVITNYNQQFVIAPVNLKKKIITPSFQFIEMKSKEDKKIEINLMHTGKLKVKGYAN